MIPLKTNRELKLMREANKIIAVILHEIRERIVPGVSTWDLDVWAEEKIRSMNAKPAFKGYVSKDRRHFYPSTLCTSVNDEVVHGIPSKDRILKEGDIIGIDVGSVYEGYHGDGAYTYAVGDVTDETRKLMECCEKALYKGIDQAMNGNRINDISTAIDRYVRSHGFEIVRDLTGHGIGKELHEEPQILNYDDGLKHPKIKSNMTFAIEPMITSGSYRVRTLDDNWTVVTSDGSLSAHYEHTVAITENGPEILTRL